MVHHPGKDMGTFCPMCVWRDLVSWRILLLLLLWLSRKEPTCRYRKFRFDPGVAKILWRKKCNPFQYSCLESPMDRGGWQATVSVQFSRSVVSNSLRPHELQHTRSPCPSPTPGVYPNSCPSSWWCHPAISPLSCPSPPAPSPSQHQGIFQWVNSSHEVAKVLKFQL